MAMKEHAIVWLADVLLTVFGQQRSSMAVRKKVYHAILVCGINAFGFFSGFFHNKKIRLLVKILI